VAAFPAGLAALRPDLDVTLIEADARKGAFLGEAARRMALKKQPKVVISRIEAAPGQRRYRDGPGARPARPTSGLGAPHRSDTAICLFHKGKGWQAN
jgi:16S rRNA (guanine527-N7)-methyltransferase